MHDYTPRGSCFALPKPFRHHGHLLVGLYGGRTAKMTPPQYRGKGFQPIRAGETPAGPLVDALNRLRKNDCLAGGFVV